MSRFHVDNLKVENNAWKFTLKDGRKFRTGLLGIGLFEYSLTAKKYKAVPGMEHAVFSCSRLVTIRKIRATLGEMEKVRTIPHEQVNFTIGSKTRGRKPRSWYVQQLTTLKGGNT